MGWICEKIHVICEQCLGHMGVGNFYDFFFVIGSNELTAEKCILSQYDIISPVIYPNEFNG